MSRAEMVEKAARAMADAAPYGGDDSFRRVDEWRALEVWQQKTEDISLDVESCNEYRAQAEAVLDAILPQVTTVEELDALPVGTKVVDRAGDVWWRRKSDRNPWQGSGGGYGSTDDPIAWIHGRFLDHCGPLTVVWSPS